MTLTAEMVSDYLRNEALDRDEQPTALKALQAAARKKLVVKAGRINHQARGCKFHGRVQGIGFQVWEVTL
jgi:predicted transcriptional regulator